MLGGYSLSVPYPQNESQRNDAWIARRNRAWMVIKEIMFNDDMNKTFFTTTEQITARTDLHDDAFYQTEGVLKQGLAYIDAFRMRPNVPGYEAFEANVVRSEIQKLYEGTSSTVNTCYVNVMNEGNRVLRMAQNRPLS